MEQKQLLDKDGNPITRERIEEVMKEVFKSEHKMGIEDNGPYGFTIHLGNGRAVHTNKAGVEMFNDAIKKWATNEYGNTEEGTSIP